MLAPTIVEGRESAVHNTLSPSQSQLSLSKDKIRVLLLEGVNDSAVGLMKAAGYSSVERLPKALNGEALTEAVKGVHLLGIRSRTQITAEVLEAADRLIAIGCFNVGVNQVDVEAARRIGVPVFNAPFSNTRSVAELVIGEIVMLLRRIIPRSVAAHIAANGTNPRAIATKSEARRSASSAMAISVRSFLILRKRLACGSYSMTIRISCATAIRSRQTA